MNGRWAQFAIGVVASGATQFGILVAAGVTSWLVISAGVLGAMGTTAAGLLKQLPRNEWPEEKRVAAQPVQGEVK